MNMSLKKSDINILIMLVGILIPVGVYALLFNSYQEKTAAINAENATLETEVAYLQDLADHKQEYIEQTEMMQEEIASIKDRFPAEYRPEDDILYIVDVEKSEDATIPSVSMGMPMLVEVAGAAQTEEATDGNDSIVIDDGSTISLYSNSISVSMTCSYDSLKEIIRRLNTDEDRKSIDTLSAVFDTETGLLSTTLAFTAYSVTGTENEYVEPSVKGVKYGTKDIFNSAEKGKAIKEEKEAEEAAEEADSEE